MKGWAAAYWILAACFLGAGCFGARSLQRRFYVLHVDTGSRPSESTVRGLIRIRDMDAESVYDKFQIVIRQSPWQLRYSGSNLWAVRPNVMVSDLIGRTMQDSAVFSAVTRELSEARPDFTMAGKLEALEIYDSEEVWYAHLALTLRLNRFGDGRQLWRFEFDERKPIGSTEVAHAVRAMSELLQLAMRRAMVNLLDAVEGVGERRAEAGPGPGAFWNPEGPRPRELEAEPSPFRPRPPPALRRPPAIEADRPFIVPEDEEGEAPEEGE